jgi:nitrite reductase/ring-hydroxylating ferredoxin subunit
MTAMWVPAASLEALDERPVVVKHHARQIAVFRAGESVYAIDNRCPHEGYPLASGKLSKDCVLTCNWHNWKFRLDTGECVIGGDDVRTYPTKVEDGRAWIDVSDPPKEERQARILQGLRGAFEDRDFGRICREMARLHYTGIDLSEGLSAALEWAHDRFEFGTTHAIAAAADWVRVASDHQDDFESRLICFSEAVDHLAFDTLRQPQYPYATAGDDRFSRTAFVAAVEDEDANRVEAMIAKALADGLHWPDMEEAFAAAAFAHYNDFGHSVIYVFKTGELASALGPAAERTLLPPLARHLCYTTREDLLPEFKDYIRILPMLPEPAPSPRLSEALAVPFPATTKSALEWVRDSLETQDAGSVYDRLLEALALNLLHCDLNFDAAFDRPVNQNVGWLDFTHGVTLSNAARKLCLRYPQFWKPALTQMACMLGRNHDFIDISVDRTKWEVHDVDAFFRVVHERLFDHGLRDPIFSAHWLKTSMAVLDELAVASESCRRTLLAALNRFLNSPMKGKHVRRLARQAIHLVGRDFDSFAPEHDHWIHAGSPARGDVCRKQGGDSEQRSNH